ncbi:C39 family peptidase [Planococcus lenghuensis]|uniref:Peptidase C39-like domain-containing protein n=1 Tax=Planococcus lenghuensis TaxID=2213202 RepID=A0A1Q2L4B4_9BACL|nr:C39 family peptidase [Planococcus lenghuensis]AQQ55290.1 hypothetical protein B0X71_19110 [Planococcus lenghuensis]
MKTSHRFIRFILLFSISFFAIGYFSKHVNVTSDNFTLETLTWRQSQTAESPRIFIVTNARNGHPLSDYTIQVLDKRKDSLVASAKSGESGQMKAKGLINGKAYQIKITSPDAISPAFEKEITYIHETTSVSFPIEIDIERKANHLNVPTVFQKPELPNGCEITALTALLNYHGIEVSKTTMADDYLPQESLDYHKNVKTGPNPYQAYAGNPRNSDGWYVFADPIVKAANSIIAVKGKGLRAENVSESTREEILSYIDQDIPVAVWVTLDLSPPVTRGGWYIKETNEFHPSFINLHTVVLDGWEDGKVYVMDPLKGRISYPEDVFFESYKALGSQAVIIK